MDMIVEIFEQKSFAGQKFQSSEWGVIKDLGLTLNDLAPVFDKMNLPLPEKDKDISKTAEGGYNLMLNRFGAVLRIFPSSIKSDPKGQYLCPSIERAEKQGKRQTVMLDPEIMPPIGHVQYEHFSLLLMPGTEHSKHSKDEIMAVDMRIEGRTGYVDIPIMDSEQRYVSVRNYGVSNGILKSFDAVGVIDMGRYDTMHRDGTLDQIVENAAQFEALQESFYSAWIGQKSFDDFWSEMEIAKHDGVLIDGWNNSPYDMRFMDKGDIVKLAEAYDRKIEVFNYSRQVSVDAEVENPQNEL